MNLCKYGCDKEGKYIQTSGKLCCSKHYSQCSENIKKNINSAAIGKYKTEDLKKKYLIQKIIRILKYYNKPHYCEYGCGKKAEYFLKTPYKWCLF